MIDWVRIPAGKFVFGVDLAIDGEASPQRIVHLPEYELSRNLICRGVWRLFREAHGKGGREPVSQPQAPQTDVTWIECVEFCDWLAASLSMPGIALPTEAQWERAYRGTDGRLFPWGDDRTAFKGVQLFEKFDDPSALPNVSEEPQIPTMSGVQDMCTHAQEWCDDRFEVVRLGDPDQRDSFGGTYKVVRGAHWSELHFETYRRLAEKPDWKSTLRGFRVARWI